MNPPTFCLLLSLSGLACLPAALHAEESRASPYRLSAAVRADVDYQIGQHQRGQHQHGHYQPAPNRSTLARTGDRRPYAQQIAFAANAAGLDHELVHAVIAVESAYQAAAVSAKGAIGLMQLMPATARSNGSEDPTEITANLRAGTRHLRGLLARFDNRLELALAAYNAGEGAVRRYGNNVPPYPETRQYVPAVIARYRANSLAATGAMYSGTSAKDYLLGTRLGPASLTVSD